MKQFVKTSLSLILTAMMLISCTTAQAHPIDDNFGFHQASNSDQRVASGGEINPDHIVLAKGKSIDQPAVPYLSAEVKAQCIKGYLAVPVRIKSKSKYPLFQYIAVKDKTKRQPAACESSGARHWY